MRGGPLDLTQSLHHAIVSVLGAAKEHRYIVFKVKVEVEDSTPAGGFHAGRTEMGGLDDQTECGNKVPKYTHCSFLP